MGVPFFWWPWKIGAVTVERPELCKTPAIEIPDRIL